VWLKAKSSAAVTVAGEKNRNDDHAHRDEHPILTVEAQKREVLNQKVQRFLLPIFWAK
jgi:hypothetical protein